MNKIQNQSGNSFAKAAEQPVNKVCLFLVHDQCLILIVRYHAKDNSISIEPAGGKIDPRQDGSLETHQEALVREASQELGVEILPRNMIAVEEHPYTRKPVAYYHCDLVSGIPHNRVPDEHLGVIQVPIPQGFEELKSLAIQQAKEIIRGTPLNKGLSRPIDFRVPETPSVLNYFQQLREESGAPFKDRPDNTAHPSSFTNPSNSLE